MTIGWSHRGPSGLAPAGLTLSALDNTASVKATVRKRADRKQLSGRVVNVTFVDHCYQSEIGGLSGPGDGRSGG
ncbi:hypothetical protein MANY_31900 [Mycolicibacterium anyangense]|uniref:Uncharacterized protein n=1 Tax=Mycolicibacterium anyangense TaxID=1431246 RepID=A0A6N4WBV9_9MYCO|nr:hypothetical protein MANY_31900 [Mycolicibacterium anyangense]